MISKLRLMTVLSLALMNGSFALAASPFDGLAQDTSLCYAQTYTAEQLARRPNQTVSKMQLKFSKNKYTTNWIALEIRSTLKGHGPKNFTQDMGCYDRGGHLHCGADCDGGQAKIFWSINEVLFKNLGRIVIHGGCGNGPLDLSEPIFLVANPQGDDELNLQKSDCVDQL